MKTRLIPLALFLALIFYAFGACAQNGTPASPYLWEAGAIVRGDTTEKSLALVFTGDSHADGGEVIKNILEKYGVKAGFFFTGHFYRNPQFGPLIHQLRKQGHYLGGHSDQHLLYCDWNQRDSLLVDRARFTKDLWNNYREMERFGIH